MMTVASFEIVKGLTRDCYAIVFGANTFVALGIQSIMTAILNSALKLLLPKDCLKKILNQNSKQIP